MRKWLKPILGIALGTVTALVSGLIFALLGAPASLVTLGGLIVGVGIFSFCDQFS
ncbi:MAG: hypothetical protein QOJ84_421 [Bradyrhizobium sp.]|jgi:ABC-type xylose transport system permease subunit|nr:hypothetical protein [Bradyrhizobium sp.]